MNRGRPKNKIPRDEKLTLRLSEFEAKKIARVADKKNLTKTDAILRGIDLLELDKPKRFKNLSGNNSKISSANIDDDDD